MPSYHDSVTTRLTILSQISNFINQREQKLNNEIAENSRKLAEQSRQDNLVNIEIAKLTVKIAEETQNDGSAMKTISIVTLIFLPGTAIAVCHLISSVCVAVASLILYSRSSARPCLTGVQTDQVTLFRLGCGFTSPSPFQSL